jgi:mono/diheme cytochrome c family protein
MPAFGESLSESELYAVVRYEREVLGGEELDEATLEERELLFEELGGGAGE